MRNLYNVVCGIGTACVNKVRRGARVVKQKAGQLCAWVMGAVVGTAAVAESLWHSFGNFISALAVAVLVGLGMEAARAEDAAKITLPTVNGEVMGIDWAGSVDEVIKYLAANLTTVLGLAVGIVAVVVIFKWLTKGASGKA